MNTLLPEEVRSGALAKMLLAVMSDLTPPEQMTLCGQMLGIALYIATQNCGSRMAMILVEQVADSMRDDAASSPKPHSVN